MTINLIFQVEIPGQPNQPPFFSTKVFVGIQHDMPDEPRESFISKFKILLRHQYGCEESCVKLLSLSRSDA